MSAYFIRSARCGMLVRNARLHITFVKKKHVRANRFRAPCDGTNGVYIRILFRLFDLNGERIHPIMRSPLYMLYKYKDLSSWNKSKGKTNRSEGKEGISSCDFSS